MSQCHNCLSKDTCEAAFHNDSCSHFKDARCEYVFNRNHPDDGGWDSKCGLIENLNRDRNDLLNDWVTCPCGKTILVKE